MKHGRRSTSPTPCARWRASSGSPCPRRGGGDEGQAAAAYRANDAALLRSSAPRCAAPRARRARQYLAERGVPEDLVERFRIGWAPDELGRPDQPPAPRAHLDRRGGARGPDRAPAERRRPLRSLPRARGLSRSSSPAVRSPASAGARMGDDTPKYLNSPESPVYKKSRALFGLPQALDAIRERGRVIVVEGYFDLLALHRAGSGRGRRAVRHRAHPGRTPTACAATPPKSCCCSTATPPGQSAAERSLPILLAEGLRVRAAFLPLGEDPDTLVAKSGAARAARLRRQRRAAARSPDRARAEGSAARSRLGGGRHRPQRRALPARALRSGRARAYMRLLSSQLEIPPTALDEALRQGKAAPDAAAPGAAPRRAADAGERLARPCACCVADARGAPELLPSFEELDLAWLATRTRARELLARLLEASRRARTQRGGAVSSPPTRSGSTPSRQALLAAPRRAERRRSSAKRAARSVSDCISELEIAAL